MMNESLLIDTFTQDTQELNTAISKLFKYFSTYLNYKVNVNDIGLDSKYFGYNEMTYFRRRSICVHFIYLKRILEKDPNIKCILDDDILQIIIK